MKRLGRCAGLAEVALGADWLVAVADQLLDPDAACQPQQREELLAEFLAGLDPARNRYLRTPDAMKALGFTGTPYRL
jgi:hypothetical protein